MGNPQIGKWLYHRSYSTEEKFWGPCQASQPEGPTKEESPESDFEGQKGLIYRASTGLRETETPLLEGAHQVSCVPRARGEKQWRQKRLSQTDLHWRVFCRGGGQQWLAPGLGPLAAAALGNTHWHEPLQKPLAPPNGLQTPGLDFLRPNNQQGRNTAPPSASTHQQTSQLKVYRAQPCPPEGQDPLPATTSPSLQEAYTRLLESFINQRMDSRSKEKLQFCSLRNRIIITDKLV